MPPVMIANLEEYAIVAWVATRFAKMQHIIILRRSWVVSGVLILKRRGRRFDLPELPNRSRFPFDLAEHFAIIVSNVLIT